MENDSLSNVVKNIDGIVRELNEAVGHLASLLKGHKITAKTQEQFQTFGARYNDYLKKLESNASFDQVNSSASAIQTYAAAIVQGLAKSSVGNNDEIKSVINKVSNLSKRLKENLEDREVVFDSEIHMGEKKRVQSPHAGAELASSSEEFKKHIESLKSELSLAEERHLKRESLLSAKLEELEQKLDTLESDVKKRIESVDSLYSEAQLNLEEKQNSVDNLLGTISEGVIARDYDSSAIEEKKMADWLRFSSLGCMAVIAVIIGFSLYETTIESFDWENASFRLVFTILLSAPAAYLARESAKHRQQQYTHLQTSLDLKAISPYLASLPIEEQHRLKSEIANRLFVPRDSTTVGADLYPINSHEILIKLLEKLDFKSR
ncbi:hypothetical protein [Halomonas sp. HAL1]|uniref:hypothetical protein n=1 Tax=Halomonas sp. HAL1 TaxID=550984 RepID=UPI00022D2AF0|nr:hypothetical protein [Halomonas sp. HAL1]EHA15431.1 hypothetical protein HAL1_11944 [Halomonas sp. HAL1]WKV93974.1 hypothetical protein Q3Y66_04875 [Halomonas sp. HAL1]